MNLNRPRLGLAGLGALILMAASACFPQSPTPAEPCPTDRPVDVYEFGDSLTAWAKNTPAPRAGESEPGFTGICQRFTEQTSVGISVNAMGGTKVRDHFPTMPNLLAGKCAMVFLATNDIGNLTLAEAKADALAAMNILRDAGVRRIVWGLLDENSASHRTAAIASKTVAYNAWLIDVAQSATYGDLLVLADWRAASAGHDDYLLLASNDPIHHTDAGADAYAAFIVASYLELCS